MAAMHRSQRCRTGTNESEFSVMNLNNSEELTVGRLLELAAQPPPSVEVSVHIEANDIFEFLSRRESFMAISSHKVRARSANLFSHRGANRTRPM